MSAASLTKAVDSVEKYKDKKAQLALLCEPTKQNVFMRVINTKRLTN